MKFKKQKKLIENLLSSPDAFALCNSIIDYEYFDPELQQSVKFILDYYEKYSNIPTIDTVESETDIIFASGDIGNDHYQYTVDEVEKFCKNMAVQDAVMQSAKIISEGGDTQLIQELVETALQVSVEKDLGLSYFDTVDERLLRMMQEADLLPTCWPTFNEHTFGGLARRELILFAANSGVGKSVALANLGLHYTEQGLNTLFITLELSEDIISQRFDTNITGISRKDWKEHTKEISSGVTNYKHKSRGTMQVKYMPTETKAVEIRTYLEQYRLHFDYYPDIICLDYLDKMTPNAKVTGNAFDVDKKISEQLRQIAVDYNLVMITASQLNRDAVGNAEQNHSHIAGGISKINESDVVVSIFKSGGAISDKLKEVNFKFLKTRNSDGVDKIIDMNFNHDKIRFEEASEMASDIKFTEALKSFEDDRISQIKNDSGGIMSKLEQGNNFKQNNITVAKERKSVTDLGDFEF